jgi:hypothetical protein
VGASRVRRIAIAVGCLAFLAIAAIAGYQITGVSHDVAHLSLGLGPAAFGLVVGFLSHVPPRYYLSWTIPLAAWMLGSFIILPLPLDYAAWAIGYAVFLALLFWDRARMSWVAAVDRVLGARSPDTGRIHE